MGQKEKPLFQFTHYYINSNLHQIFPLFKSFLSTQYIRNRVGQGRQRQKKMYVKRHDQARMKPPHYQSNLRGHAAMNLNICCTVFWDVFFRFQGEILMHFEPFQPTNRLLVLKTAFRQIAENSTFAILLSKISLFYSHFRGV